MKRILSHPLTPVIALCLLASWSLLLHPSLPRQQDVELHIFRAAEIGYNLRDFHLYSRWAPDFYYGFGYPLFNYYAPLTYYLANLFSLAIPGGAVFGIKAVMVLTFFIGGIGTYLFSRRLTTHPGGVIATAVYLFAPYIYMTNPHMRGAVAEFLALGLAPLAFWAVAVYHDDPSRRYFLLATAPITAIILSHNLMALVFFAMLSVYTLWRFATDHPTLKNAGLRILPLILGLALSAFFWLVVMLEQDAVQLSNLLSDSHFDFRNHFQPLRALLASPEPLDRSVTVFDLRLNIGVAQWVMGLAGAGVLAWKQRHAEAFFWAISAVGLLFLMLPASRPLWEAIPQMAYLQFPWRLLGPLALCLAVLSSFTVYLADELPDSIAAYTTPALLALPLLLALPIFVPRGWAPFGPSDRAAIYIFDNYTTSVGTTATGDFIPAAVDEVPPPQPPLETEYWQADGVIDRVAAPPDTEIIRQRPTDYRLRVSTEQATTLRLYHFAFTGWRASIDGEPAAITPTDPEGWISVEVPPGEHEIRVWMGPTPARIVSTVISVVGLAATVGIAYLLPASTRATYENQPGERLYWKRVLAGFVLIALISTQGNIFQPHSRGFLTFPRSHTANLRLEEGIGLESYEVSRTTVEPGGIFTVTLRWTAYDEIPANYRVFVHVIPENTPQLVTQSDKLHPAEFPTSRWPLERPMWDTHAIVLPENTPSGRYQVLVGIWDAATGERLPLVAGEATMFDKAIVLEPLITVP